MKNRVPTKKLDFDWFLPVKSTFFLKRSWLEDPYTKLFGFGVWPEVSYKNWFLKKCWSFWTRLFPEFVQNCPKIIKSGLNPSLILNIWYILYILWYIPYILYIISYISSILYQILYLQGGTAHAFIFSWARLVWGLTQIERSSSRRPKVQPKKSPFFGEKNPGG